MKGLGGIGLVDIRESWESRLRRKRFVYKFCLLFFRRNKILLLIVEVIYVDILVYREELMVS